MYAIDVELEERVTAPESECLTKWYMPEKRLSGNTYLSIELKTAFTKREKAKLDAHERTDTHLCHSGCAPLTLTAPGQLVE